MARFNNGERESLEELAARQRARADTEKTALSLVIAGVVVLFLGEAFVLWAWGLVFGA